MQHQALVDTMPRPDADANHADALDAKPDRQKNWFLRHKILTGTLAAVALFGVVGALSPDSEGDNTHSEAVTSTPESGSGAADTGAEAPADAPVEDAAPSQEDKFIDAVEAAADDVDGADNELQVVKARHARAKAIQQVLRPSIRVKNWTGTVEDVSTTLGGDSGVVEISLTDDIKVATWNNGGSDFMDHTLIDVDSPLYDRLADLSEGDKVSFSGKFIRDAESGIGEQSLLDENGMTTPTFTFKFASLKES